MFPQGLPTVGQITDPEGRRPGWQHVPSGEGGRDLKLVDVMLAWARKEHRVDPARVSPPATRTADRWCRPCGPHAAASSRVCTVFIRLQTRRDRERNPRPAFIVTGRQDQLVPLRAQELSLSRVLKLKPAATTNQAWDGTARLHPSKAGADVVTYIHPGGHRLPADAGVMVKFFKQR